jgi:UDP-N-acetylmuramate--alanine ligase
MTVRQPGLWELPAAGAHIHLVGIGGAGMRGLGLLLDAAGYRVSGCDRSGVDDLVELSDRGARLASGHDPAHIEEADLVVHTSAVPAEHPELRAAADLGVPTMKRSRALAALLNERRLAAVAGTHGKTSITALAGLACTAADLDPIVAVGGRVAPWQGYARDGRGEVAVVEADEYDRSFLDLNPSLVLISSVEAEHLDTYGSVESLDVAFRTLAGRAEERDGVLYCADDPGACRIGQMFGGLGYGFAADADYRVEVLVTEGSSQLCRLFAPGGEMQFRLELPGRHNAQNAAAALAIALNLSGPAGVGASLPGVAPSHEAELLASDALRQAFSGFHGVDRRLQLLSDQGGVALLDDYAHHPTEVEASLAAVRSAYPNRRLIAVFQPHLFSRTQMFAGEFAAALAAADEAFVLPIYPAREKPIPGVDAGLIAEAADDVRLATDVEALETARSARRPAAVVFMGAGDVTALARRAADERADAVGG